MCIIDPAGYQELSFILIALYLIKAMLCFTSWFKRFSQDSSLSNSEKRFCLKILTLATIFWPIVLPISSLEKRLIGSPLEGEFRIYVEH